MIEDLCITKPRFRPIQIENNKYVIYSLVYKTMWDILYLSSIHYKP